MLMELGGREVGRVVLESLLKPQPPALPHFLVVFQCPPLPPLQFLVCSCYGTVAVSRKGCAGFFE